MYEINDFLLNKLNDFKSTPEVLAETTSIASVLSQVKDLSDKGIGTPHKLLKLAEGVNVLITMNIHDVLLWRGLNTSLNEELNFLISRTQTT